MENQATETPKADAAKRTKKTAYYIVSAPIKFDTKAKLESFLTDQGGIPAGQAIIKGVAIAANTKQVFRIN